MWDQCRPPAIAWGACSACPAMSSARFPHPLALLTALHPRRRRLQLSPPGRSVRTTRRPGDRAPGRAWQARITAWTRRTSVPFQAHGRDPEGPGGRRARSSFSSSWSAAPSPSSTRPARCGRRSGGSSGGCRVARRWSSRSSRSRSPLGGALENMSEEIIALVPVLLLVTRRLGFDAVTAVAISLGRGRRRRGVQSDQPVPGADRAEARRAAAALRRRRSASCCMALALATWIIAARGAHAIRTAASTGGAPTCRSQRAGSTRAPCRRPRARARHVRGVRLRRHAARVGLRSDVRAVLRDGARSPGSSAGSGSAAPRSAFVDRLHRRWRTPRC